MTHIRLLLTLTLSFVGFSSFAADFCQVQQTTRQVVVKKVLDGDTIETAKGQRLRLIGINTPEKRRRHRGRWQDAEPLADEATAALRHLVQQHQNKIQIHDGIQRHDRYGRLLVHAFAGKTNLQHALLSKGLAYNLPIQPNLRYQGCYQRAQADARKAKRGLWSSTHFKPLNAARLNRRTKTGFRLIVGEIQSVSATRSVIWLNFNGARLAAKISRHDRQHFKLNQLKSLRTRTVHMMGYLVKRRRAHPRFGAYILLLRHPDMIW